MAGMGAHTAVNGHRGEDGAATVPPFPVLDMSRLVPLRGPVSDLPAAASISPEPQPAFRHREYRVLAAAAPVAVVALVAGIVSYSHIVALSLRAGQSVMDAHLSPIPVDGLIVGGSVILWFGSWLGWFAVAPGVAATLFANVESGLPHGALSAAVAAWPAVAFSVATIVLERWLKSQAAPPAASPSVESAEPSVDTTDGGPVPPAEPPDSRQDEPQPPPVIVASEPPAEPASKPVSRRQPQQTAVAKAAAAIRRHPDWNDAKVAASAGVSERSVQRARCDLNGAKS